MAADPSPHGVRLSTASFIASSSRELPEGTLPSPWPSVSMGRSRGAPTLKRASQRSTCRAYVRV